MGQVTYCDLCNEVIHNRHKKYILGVNAVTEDEVQNLTGYKDVYDEIQKNANSLIHGKIKLKEICQGCKDVLDNFFSLRKHEIEAKKLEVEKLLKTNMLDDTGGS